MFPIRCYTCGKVLGHLSCEWETTSKAIADPNSPVEDWSEFFVAHNLKRYCCRRTVMSHCPDPNIHQTVPLPPSVRLSEEDVPKRIFIAH